MQASFALLAMICLVPCFGCNQSGEAISGMEIVKLSGRTMGTTYRIKTWFQSSEVPEKTDRDALQSNVDRLLAEINDQMSTYLPESELSKFNTAPVNRWYPVSSATALVTAEALKYHEQTSGALDVTVGPLVRLWGFGPQSQGDVLAGGKKPDPDQINNALSLVGCQHLRVRSEPPALQKMVEGVEIDLSSLAKGYAVDRVIELLRQRGAGGAMAEIGGEIRTLGTREDGTDWRIGIENPSPEQRDIFRVVHLRDAALATSGDYRNFHSFEGIQYCHIIDPRTGHPLPARRASVTVCAATCMEADALATALFLIGAEQGREWCEEHDVAAMFLTLKDGKVVETHTSQFDQYLQ